MVGIDSTEALGKAPLASATIYWDTLSQCYAATKSQKTGGWRSFLLKNCYIASEEQRCKAATSRQCESDNRELRKVQLYANVLQCPLMEQLCCAKTVDSCWKCIYYKKQLPTCPIKADYVTYVVSINLSKRCRLHERTVCVCLYIMSEQTGR